MKLALVIFLITSDISPDVKKYVGSAAALFEKLEYEKALAQLKRAKTKSQGPEDDLKIALFEGVVLAEMGDAGAPAAFAAALGMEPTATLPVAVSPKVQKVFDKAKAQVQKVLDAQAEVDRKRAEEAKKKDDEKRAQEEANRPAPPPTPPPAVVVEQPKPAPKGKSLIGIVPLGLGVVGGGVGAVLLVLANGAHSALMSGQPNSLMEAQRIAASGSLMQTTGWIAVGVGAAALVVGLILLLL